MSGQANPTRGECDSIEEIDKEVAYIMEGADDQEDYTVEDRVYILACGGYTREDLERYWKAKA